MEMKINKKIAGEVLAAGTIALIALGIAVAALVFGITNDRKTDHTLSPTVVRKETKLYHPVKPYKKIPAKKNPFPPVI